MTEVLEFPVFDRYLMLLKTNFSRELFGNVKLVNLVKLVLPNFGELWYFTVFRFPQQGGHDGTLASGFYQKRR
jgi:hypothetical protein